MTWNEEEESVSLGYDNQGDYGYPTFNWGNYMEAY